jgi:hypothetical protein
MVTIEYITIKKASFNLSHLGPVERHHKPTPKFMNVYRMDQKISVDPLYLKAAMVAIVTLAKDNPTNNPYTNNPTITKIPQSAMVAIVILVTDIPTIILSQH